MDEKNRRQKEKEMRESWNNMEFQFRELLSKIDYKARVMISEMKSLGVPKDMIAEFLPEQFNRLAQEVMEENERGKPMKSPIRVEQRAIKRENIDRERKPVNGPVIPYKLSEEELAYYRSLKPPKKEKRPINLVR